MSTIFSNFLTANPDMKRSGLAWKQQMKEIGVETEEGFSDDEVL